MAIAPRRCIWVVTWGAVAFLVTPAPASGEGLVGHWTFDEKTGPTAKDASGAGHDAMVHAAARTDGKVGGALRFDGKGSYVALGDLGELDRVTIAFWMKGENVGGRDWQGLVTSDAWDKGVCHIAMRNHAVEVYLHLGDARRGRLTSPRLTDDVWYHVAITADTKAGTMQLFLNGVEEDVAEGSRLPTRIKLIKQVVGRENGGRYFKGVIDDVRIYARALSTKEIRMMCPDAAARVIRDPRNLRAGLRIPNEGYCDQPYIVINKDGHWLCTLTTGPGREGQKGQHIVATLSTDQGQTWSELIDIEPTDGPEASWVVPLATPGGRIYAFYTYNGENVRTLRGKEVRVDTLGWYAFRHSDDGGRTWSKQRYRIPMRLTACDRGNDWQGKVQLFWGIDKPKVTGGVAYFAFTKLGKYMLDNGEGWLYRSDNVLSEPDVTKLHWELLPDGEHGLRVDAFGSVQEEHNMVPMTDGKSLHCVYRTTTGYPCHTYSRDGGHTWTEPEHMTYTPGGRRIKNPRACPKLWRTQNGRYLFWFHNHSGKSFTGRNPVWIAGGLEKNGHIRWSQPEILLYDPVVETRMSYPDLVEQDGRYWVTETNKTTARVHQIDRSLLEGLWNQGKARQVTRDGLVLEMKPAERQTKAGTLSKRVDVNETRGLAIDLWIAFKDLTGGQVIADSRDANGRGIALTTTDGGAIRIYLSDGKTKATWDCDPGALQVGKRHHVAAIVDEGPKIITFVIDGTLCDGGDARQHGWGRYDGELGDVSGTGKLRITASDKHRLECIRIYGRHLRTSEAVANYHAGR